MYSNGKFPKGKKQHENKFLGQKLKFSSGHENPPVLPTVALIFDAGQLEMIKQIFPFSPTFTTALTCRTRRVFAIFHALWKVRTHGCNNSCRRQRQQKPTI